VKAWRRRGVTLILAVVGLVICSLVVIAVPRTSARSTALTSNLPGTASQGGQIAITSARSAHDEIYTVRADGTDLRQLTFGTKENFAPIWSPDGSKIAYSQVKFFPPAAAIPPAAQPPISIHVMNADGSDQRNVTPEESRDFGAFSWSPDGTRLAVECPPAGSSGGNGQICVLNIDGTGLQRLVPPDLLGFTPSWSPDGRWIAFRSQPPEGMLSGIYVVSPDGSHLRPVLNVAEVPSPPVWSSDGTKLAYIHGMGYAKLAIVNVDGSDSHDLDTGHQYPSNPSWSPVGNTLLFLTSSPGQSFSGLSVIDADGTGIRDIALNSDDIAWAVWSSDGQSIAVKLSFPEQSLATAEVGTQRIALEVLPLDGTSPRTLIQEPMIQEPDAIAEDAWLDSPPSWQPVAKTPGT
jgi:Tol biopolymer transport system component